MSDRIRVLTLTDRFGPIGGAERLASQIAERLDPERFESVLCGTRWSADDHNPDLEETLEELRAAGVRVVGLGRSKKLDVGAWRRLVRELRSSRIDVLHAHQFGSNVWGTVMGRLARTPVVVAHEHTWSYEGQPLRKLADRHVVARGADAFIAVSREDERRMMEIEKIPAHVIRYIPNGSPPLPPPDGPSIREELGIALDAPVIGSVGSIRRQKAYDVLVDAALLLRDDHPGLRVLIAGNGHDEERIRAYIADNGAGDVVTILGHRYDLPELLAGLDLAVSSSDYEGMPLSMLEFMSARLPIVATRVGGVPDVVVDGETGLLVERGDARALAGALDTLLRDPERRRAMGEAGHARRAAEFDLDVMVRRIEELYVELLGRRRRDTA